MKHTPSTEYLALLTAFERFLILNSKKLILSFFVFAFAFTAVGVAGLGGPRRPPPESARLQTARSLNLLLFSYANDHDQKYPVGKSSTEIFQQLLDQGYASDPSIFYFPMAGKTAATSNKLKSENVCFDVTNGVLPDDSDQLPVVFSTGYKIDYLPGGKAHLLATGDPKGIAVSFKSNSSMFLRAQPSGIPLFPPASISSPDYKFDPKGRTYQQLTPDGLLP